MNIPIDKWWWSMLLYPCTPNRIHNDTFDRSCDCSRHSFQSPIDIWDNPLYEQRSSWLFLSHPCTFATTFSPENRRMANIREHVSHWIEFLVHYFTWWSLNPQPKQNLWPSPHSTVGTIELKDTLGIWHSMAYSQSGAGHHFMAPLSSTKVRSNNSEYLK